MADKIYTDDKPKSLEKEVGLWHERINLAKKEQERWADESGAKRFIKEYKNNYGIVFHARKRQIPIPAIGDVFSYVQSDISSTYNRDPYITVNAEAGTVKGAALWEVIINYYWRFLKTKEEIESEIMDKDLIGYAFHKVGYSAQSSGSGDQVKLDNETFYSKYVNWKDIVWNIGSKNPPHDCMWMAQRIVLPLSRIKKLYPNAKNLEGSPDPRVDKTDYKKSSYKDDIKVGVLWEVWDAEEKKVRILAESIEDKYLDVKDWPDYLKEFPFLMYWDFLNPDSRPMSAIAPWEPQILEEMILTAQIVQFCKRWNRQAFANKLAIDDNALDKFERGDDGAIITVAGKIGQDDLRFVDFGQFPPEFFAVIDRLQAIKRNVNGQPEFVKGGVTKTGTRTIGELNLMQQGNKSRQDRKIDRLETHCENIARQLMAHLKANFDFDNVVKITGEAPQEIIDALGNNFDPITRSVKFSLDEIDGEYDVDIKAGSTLALDKQTRMNVYEIVMNTVSAAAAQGPMSHFMSALVEGMLQDYDVKALKEAYKMDLMEAEQAKAQAQGQQSVEDQKTQAEAEKRMAQSQQIQVDTEISIEEAKLKQLQDPGEKISESINFKDLPPEGKVAMAGKAGIHINPQQIITDQKRNKPVKNGL